MSIIFKAKLLLREWWQSLQERRSRQKAQDVLEQRVYEEAMAKARLAKMEQLGKEHGER